MDQNDGTIQMEIVGHLPRLSPSELDTVLGHVRAYALYRQDSYPERQCDNCQKPYRGPAVYCCLGCALSDT